MKAEEREAKRLRAVELYGQGMSLTAVAVALSVCEATIPAHPLDAGGVDPIMHGPGWPEKQRLGYEKSMENIKAMRRSKPAKCSVCNDAAPTDRFRGAWYCGACLQTAGDYDPDYEAAQASLCAGYGNSAIARAAEMCDTVDRYGQDIRPQLDRKMRELGIEAEPGYRILQGVEGEKFAALVEARKRVNEEHRNYVARGGE